MQRSSGEEEKKKETSPVPLVAAGEAVTPSPVASSTPAKTGAGKVSERERERKTTCYFIPVGHTTESRADQVHQEASAASAEDQVSL